MTDFGIFLFLFWLVICLFVFAITRDIASPPMMFLACLGSFFSDIFFTNYSDAINAIYLIILMIILLSTIVYVIKYKKMVSSYNKDKVSLYRQDIKKQKSLFILFWFLSLPSIVGQFYMIYMFGGVTNFLIAAQFGTREFHGLGPIKTIISTYYPVGLFYFAYLIKSKKNNKQIIIFVFHFFILIIMALFTLSRGTLLTHIVFMVLVWHYGKSRISPAIITPFLVITMFLAALMGVVRESFSITDGEIKSGLENRESIVKRTWMYTGLLPLDRVLEANHVEKHYGLTYLTVFTNFVPRSLWPEKPPPGGVVFTNEYASNMYDEYSHFTTGLFPEAIINFGVEIGILFGVCQLFFLIVIISYYHKKKFMSKSFKMRTNKDVLATLIYVYTVWHFSILLSGEFTSVMIGLIIKILGLLIVYFALKIFQNFRITIQ